MSISSSKLLLEIGSEAYERLTPTEISAICMNANSVLEGAMKAFELLWKKYEPTYKMGKMYIRESDRYETYRRIHNWYCQKIRAGIVKSASNE